MTQERKLRIVLADDHAVVREGLKMLINVQPDLEVVGEAADGEAAFEEICCSNPDVVLLDISMPRVNGIELIPRLTRLGGNLRILALTANEDLAYLQQLLKLGAAGYLLKRSAADELIRAIRTVATGARYIDSSVIEGLVDNLLSPARIESEPSSAVLSEREEKVLRLIAQGNANKEVAAKMGISMKTVETYKSRSMLKLGLRGRADIVRYAVSHDWLRE